MAGSVEQAGQRSRSEAATDLLSEAAAVREGILAAAHDEAAGLLAAAARDTDRLLGLAARHAGAVQAAAGHRAASLRERASEDADAELRSAGRRSREALLAARLEGERRREGARNQGRQIGTGAERRADDVLASARAAAAQIEASARAAAETLLAGAEHEAGASLEEARLGLDAAAFARAAAEQEAIALKEQAARSAEELIEGPGQDFEMARRVRSIACRDASQAVAAAMAEASQALHLAALQYDVANDLLAQEERALRPRLGLCAPRARPTPSGMPAAGVVEEGRPEPPPVADGPMDAPTVPDPADRASDRGAPSLALPTVEVEPDIRVAADGFAPPTLVPVLSFEREFVLRLIVLGAAGTTGWFWLWWLASGHGEWTFGSVTATALLAWVFGLSGYFFFFVCRMSRPNPEVPVPDLRVAMVVTKAPGEAWDVLQRTLEAMLAQDYEEPYDIWLADERPTLETLHWCLGHEIKVSTRYGVEEYHRATWPRRTKSKEGNLSWFYDQVGYERYDAVVQLDADHVPGPAYLQAMVRPFANPAVGYVAAPSICDANAGEGWTVRGRLYREAAMHGPVQAGCNGGYAPVCIGSHYAVRTAALRDIGGIGPELAEDYSTTLWFQSAGWDGVFNIDAVAHGDGPATVEEMLVQEIQWSRSLGTILLRWAPGKLGTVPWRARCRLAFALIYYLVSGLVVAMASAAPVLGVLLHTSWGNTSLASFYIHLWPQSLVSMGMVIFLRRCMVLRPVDGKVWSWELILFQLVRWPWVLWGFLQGLYAGVRSKVINFGVTPKSVPGPRALPLKYLAPTLALGALQAWTVILVGNPGPAIGLLIITAIQAVIYMGCASLVVALHLTANRRRRLSTAPAQPTPPLSSWVAGQAAAAVTFGVVAPTAVALVWRLSVL